MVFYNSLEFLKKIMGIVKDRSSAIYRTWRNKTGSRLAKLCDKAEYALLMYSTYMLNMYKGSWTG